MELNQLRYFVKLSEVQNFSKAAEELYITQPTLSQQIKRLETELGIELFTRSTRSVALTESGKQCYEHAKAALDHLDLFVSTAQEIQRQSEEHITVGILAVLPHWDISVALEEFAEEYPQINCSLEFDWSKALVEQLLDKKLDLIIGKVFWDRGDPKYQKLNVSTIDDGLLYVLVGKNHRLAKERAVKLEELSKEKILTADQHACVVQYLNQLANSKGMKVLEYNEVRSNRSMFRMIEAGMGVSVMSNDIVQEYNYKGVKLLPLDPDQHLQTAIVTRKGLKEDSPAQIFKKYILEFIEDTKEI